MGKKVLSALVNALCVFAILISLVAAWTVLTTPRGKAPQVLGWSMLTVLTGSMEPALPEGSLIFVRAVPAGDIQVGDVITFYATLAGHDGVLNTHRVTQVVDEGGTLSFLTKGDANAIGDTQPVQAEQVLGRVALCSPGLGGAIALLRRPYVFLPLVLLPLLALIARSALRLWRLGKEEVARAQHELEEAQDHDHRDPGAGRSD